MLYVSGWEWVGFGWWEVKSTYKWMSPLWCEGGSRQSEPSRDTLPLSHCSACIHDIFLPWGPTISSCLFLCSLLEDALYDNPLYRCPKAWQLLHFGFLSTSSLSSVQLLSTECSLPWSGSRRRSTTRPRRRKIPRKEPGLLTSECFFYSPLSISSSTYCTGLFASSGKS